MRTLILILLMVLSRPVLGAYSGLPSNWVNNGSTNADLPGIGTANAMVITNGVSIPGVTVANLGSASTAGVWKYCSDCLTPWGTGSAVVSDGTDWKLQGGPKATTSVRTYMIECLRYGFPGRSTKYDVVWVDNYLGSTTGYIVRSTSAANGGSITVSGQAVSGENGILSQVTGAASNGSAPWSGGGVYVVNSSGDLLVSARVEESQLSAGGDEYYTVWGLSNGGTLSSATDAVAWVYDRANTLALTGGTAANWKLVTRKASTTTVTESSTAVTAGTAQYHNISIYIAADGSVAAFYFDGVQLGSDISANVPASGTVLRMEAEMLKSAGTTSCLFNTMQQSYQARRPGSGINFF